MSHKRTVTSERAMCRPLGGWHMSAWWWVMIGLAAWLGISLAVGLLLARFFRHAAQARDALDALAEERLADRQEPPQDGPRVALRASKRGCQAPGRALAGAGVPVGLVPAAARARCVTDEGVYVVSLVTRPVGGGRAHPSGFLPRDRGEPAAPLHPPRGLVSAGSHDLLWTCGRPGRFTSRNCCVCLPSDNGGRVHVHRGRPSCSRIRVSSSPGSVLWYTTGGLT